MNSNDKFIKYFNNLEIGKEVTVAQIQRCIKISRQSIVKYLLELAIEHKIEIERDIYRRIIGVKKL